ncbi:MAG: type I restriction endonuclease subunit R [Bacteroidales bacterium]|nr:type I restriction endonuclease subunit R [Bacteroidales bacterium]
MTEQYHLLSENNTSTVVSHYKREAEIPKDYQTEAELEDSFIAQLQRQGYEFLDIHTEQELIDNLRRQIELLNSYKFSDNEWKNFFATEIVGEKSDIIKKTYTIQKDCVKCLKQDNGQERNIMLLNKKDIHANSTQVIHQYTEKHGNKQSRYDVSILVNGLPLVHVELKKRGVSIREAFNQIDRYFNESFSEGCGLFEYVQLFVISNGTLTKYYSNTTRKGHLENISRANKSDKKRSSHSFEFTSYWADAHNNILNDLVDFTATFFTRHTLLNVLLRFCVLTQQDTLLVMRPYQIAAAEAMLNKIEKSHNMHMQGTLDACGYVWHTTGSGKTLTSFKAAQLATKYDFIDKVVFVVDRKDLDYQTMKEYDRFEKGAANGNTSTKILQHQLEDYTGKTRILITTIQKLSAFIKKNKEHNIYNKNIVMVFDECHRSQFGKMHADIIKKFKNYYIFGFTGTPIFDENKADFRTTDMVFGERLHTYTIVDAIRDNNVLPFRVTYISTIKEKKDIENAKVWDIARETALMAPQRISNITKYILEHYAEQTKQAGVYSFSRLNDIDKVVGRKSKTAFGETHTKTQLNGFNSMLTVQSIEAAKLYYEEFKKQLQSYPEEQRLKVATIFSFGTNDGYDGEIDDENSDSTDEMDAGSREFLSEAIKDYNKMFAVEYDVTSEKFANYYKDVSLRMKNRELDILIVVNMFLTGFDATTLNTLWVDKNLKYHGLIQAYSRTNRILNTLKNAGNIVCFRNLEDQTNSALSLYGDAQAKSVAILRPFKDYFYGYTDKDGTKVEGYVSVVDKLRKFIPAGSLPSGEANEKKYIELFGDILRRKNVLQCFEEFEEKNPIKDGEMQNYRSIYIALYEKYRKNKTSKAVINDDIEFEMELIKQVEVNIDYILYLVEVYKKEHQTEGEEIRNKINRAILSSLDLRDKKDLINKFIDSMTAKGDVYAQWQQYINEQKKQEFDQIITEENLQRDEAIDFIQSAFSRGYVPEGGMAPAKMMPPINPFDPEANRQGKFEQILDRIKNFFTKYFGFANGEFDK